MNAISPKLFIQANNKQVLGALLAKWCALKTWRGERPLEVHIMNVDDMPIFKNFNGKAYLRKGKLTTYDKNDLQSFTLTRFMPPGLSSFEGKALVIDPDIFALKDISPVFNIDMGEASVLACRKKDAYDSSVMLFDCSKFKNYKIEDILKNLSDKKIDYDTVMTLKNIKKVGEIPRIWNNLDNFDDETIMIHTTDRLTQPWKTGLKIDFTIHDQGKYFGIIPKRWLLKLRGKIPTHYLPHPNKNIDNLIFKLIKGAVDDGAIKIADIQREINLGNVRADLIEIISSKI